MHEKSHWGGKVPLDFRKTHKLENTDIHSDRLYALLPCTLAPAHLPDKYVLVRGRSVENTLHRLGNPAAQEAGALTLLPKWHKIALAAHSSPARLVA
jgi:hypothetical protein